MERVMEEIRDARRGNWFWVTNNVIDDYLPKIGATAFAVYSVLCRMANNSTGQCNPKVMTIAERIGMSEPTVRRAIATLVEHNLIISEERVIDGRQRPNRYTVVEAPDVKQTITSDTPVTDDTHQSITDDIPRPITDDRPLNKTLSSNKTKNEQDKNIPPRRNEQKLMFGAIANVTGLDPIVNRGMIARAAKTLRQAGYTPEQVASLYGKGGWYYKNDWRGKQGQKPNVAVINRTIQEASKHYREPTVINSNASLEAMGV